MTGFSIRGAKTPSHKKRGPKFKNKVRSAKRVPNKNTKRTVTNGKRVVVIFNGNDAKVTRRK